MELETDKVTVEIPSPADGTLFEVLKQVDAEVTPDEVLARLQSRRRSRRRCQPPSAAASTVNPDRRPAPRDESDGPCAAQAVEPLGPAAPHGTCGCRGRHRGHGTRWTHHRAGRDASRGECAGAAGAVCADEIADATCIGGQYSGPAHRHAPAHGRAHGAQHAEAPHVTTLFEADLTRVLAHRARHAADFESRGARLTLTAYFISACARALRAHRKSMPHFTRMRSNCTRM